MPTETLITPTETLVTPTDLSALEPQPKAKRGRKSKAISTTIETETNPTPQAIAQTQPEVEPEINQAMHVQREQEVLALALTSIKPAIPTNPLQPVLGYVLFETTSKQASFTTSDLTFTLKATVKGNFKPGKQLIPNEVVDVISCCAPGLVELVEQNQNNNAHIVITDCGRGTTTLACQTNDEFPQITVDTPQFSLPAKVLLVTLKAAMVAAHPKPEKNVLHGVHWQLDPSSSTLFCEATDGSRVAQVTVDVSGIGKKKRNNPTDKEASITCTLRLPFVKELCRVLTNVETESQVNFAYDPDSQQVLFKVALSETVTLEMIGRCFDAPYPELESYINRFNFPKTALFDRLEFTTRLERLTAIASNEAPIVKLHFIGTTVTLTKEEETLQSQQVMEAVIDQSTENFEICFNLYYLLRFLKAIDSSAVKIGMEFATSLMKLEVAGDTPQVEVPLAITYYVMPMQNGSKET
jgi:DNA polymerase III sliding clamp (beta) subunit (PCNA family)